MAAENLRVAIFIMPADIVHGFYEPQGMPQRLLVMIVIQGRKGWNSRG